MSDYPCLNLTALLKKGFIITGQQGQTSSTSSSGRQLWSFGWCINLDSINVRYQILNGINQGDYFHQVKLVEQAAHYGNSRYYFECSKCYRRCKQIYFKGGVDACRTCHKLHYHSQSESVEERHFRKLDRLLSQVNCFGYRFDGYYKPKWQHWKTYYALDAKIISTQQVILKNVEQRFGISDILL
ncbi:hypothetical protein ACP3VW_05885 [Vibrio sp. DNB22_17_1]